MRCVVPGRSLKLFAKAIHCLSKIGEELYLEALPDGVALRTVNLSRSAYACFKFHSSFFISYDDGSKDLPDDSDAEDMLKCKIAMKSCLIVFKSINTIEKHVDRCKIDLNVRQGRLIFLLYCKHGITKTHNLTFQECETLQAVFTKDLCPNFITAQPKVLSDAVCNFPNNQEELTLSVTTDATVFKNYTDDEPDPNKVIHTQMNLSSEEFDNYQIGVDTNITFCLKELRAILAFGDVSGQPLNIHFETGGKPIVFSMDADSTYESDFVLATLVDDPPSSQASQAPSQALSQATSQAPSTKYSSQKSKLQNGKMSTTAKSKLSQSSKGKSKGSQPSQQSVAKQKNSSQQSVAKQQSVTKQQNSNNYWAMGMAQGDEAESEEASFSKDHSETSSQNEQGSRQKTKKLSMIPESSQENVIQASLNTSANPLHTPRSSVTDVSFLHNLDMPSLGDVSPSSQQFHRSFIQTKASQQHQDDSDEEMDDDDIVPGTPPSKKFKSMFFGTHSEKRPEVVTKGNVLAADTDDEDSD